MAEALRHLGIAEHRAAGLIYIAAGQGRHQDARRLAAEATVLAQTVVAGGIIRQVEEAGTAISEPQ
jgi:hypothetical protein